MEKKASANSPASIPTILPTMKRMRTMIRPIRASNLPNPPNSMVGKTNDRRAGCAMRVTLSRFVPHRQAGVVVDFQPGVQHHLPAELFGLEAEPGLVSDQLSAHIL